MSERTPTASEAKPNTSDAARIELSGMNGVGHGFGMSVEGATTGGVFVSKEASGDIGGAYVNEDEALRALAAEKSPQQLDSIQSALAEAAARRLTVDALPGAKRPNDRLVSVNIGDERVGGGAKFIGNQEMRLPNGRYINEADLKAAIAGLQEAIEDTAETSETVAPVAALAAMEAAQAPFAGQDTLTESAAAQPEAQRETGVDQKDKEDTSAEKKSRRRLLKAVAAAATLLALISPTLGSEADAPERTKTVAAASADTMPGSDILPAEDADQEGAGEETETPVTVEVGEDSPEPEKNWMITEGMGGEDLFNQLGVDPMQWYGMQDTLVAQYPEYFYRSDAGDVRFAYPGEVPTEIQQTIESMLQ